jgi:hypothetical protein
LPEAHLISINMSKKGSLMGLALLKLTTTLEGTLVSTLIWTLSNMGLATIPAA